MPRENFNTDVRVKIQEILKRHLDGASAEFTVQLSDAVLARIHMLVRSSPARGARATTCTRSRPTSPRRRAAGKTTSRSRSSRRWARSARPSALRTYAGAFPVAYRDTVSPRAAVRDLAVIEALGRRAPLRGEPLPPGGERRAHAAPARLPRSAAPVPLSAQPAGAREHGPRGARRGLLRDRARRATEPVHVHDFGLRSARPIPDVEAIKRITEEALRARGAPRDRERRLQPPHAAAPRSRPTR